MFQVEVRQFPHSGRRFNMTPAEVGHFLQTWVAGRPVALGDPGLKKVADLGGSHVEDRKSTRLNSSH